VGQVGEGVPLRTKTREYFRAPPFLSSEDHAIPPSNPKRTLPAVAPLPVPFSVYDSRRCMCRRFPVFLFFLPLSSEQYVFSFATERIDYVQLYQGFPPSLFVSFPSPHPPPPQTLNVSAGVRASIRGGQTRFFPYMKLSVSSCCDLWDRQRTSPLTPCPVPSGPPITTISCPLKPFPCSHSPIFLRMPSLRLQIPNLTRLSPLWSLFSP